MAQQLTVYSPLCKCTCFVVDEWYKVSRYLDSRAPLDSYYGFRENIKRASIEPDKINILGLVFYGESSKHSKLVVLENISVKFLPGNS